MDREDESTGLFRSSFSQMPDGLVTNEYAFAGSTWDGPGRSSPEWEVTSGSLFVQGGLASTGVPDDANGGRTPVNAASANVTNSAVFRVRTTRADFGDVTVTMPLKIHGFCPGTSATPAQDWDGVHLFLRYLSPFNLYYASVARRDGRVVIKRKVSGIPASAAHPTTETVVSEYYQGPPGNVSNHGAYYTLAQTPKGSYPWTVGQGRTVGATIVTNPDATCTITVTLDGVECLRVNDDGSRYAADWRGRFVGWDGTGRPITEPGRVGIRSDNAEITFGAVVVRAR